MPEVLPPRKRYGTYHSNQSEPNTNNDPWLANAQAAFDASTSFLDTNLRKMLEGNIAHFQNRHMQGSKYLSEHYKYRSKMFRPKARSTVRQVEAATHQAFFSQLDVISIEAEEPRNNLQEASAALRTELLNYRLSGKDQIPWFQVCIGGMQEANVYGVVGSKQYWLYQEEEVDVGITVNGQNVMDSETGQPATTKQRIKVKDRPDIRLYPLENLRFDPAANWTDVVNSSPYFIAMESMRIDEVKEKIERGEWLKVDDSVLMSARNTGFDTTRQEREDGKEDSTESRYSKPLSDFDMVWVHENFIRLRGKDMHFYTLGTIARLTDPKPLKEAYLHGRRPFVVGTCVIEAHKAIPDSPIHLAKGLQKEANEVANSRLENVKLALNKRWFAKRGKQVDLQSLVRNVPGSVTLMNDPTTDVVGQEFNDVTASSYAEQDRINVDHDELLGSFSAGSIATNRKLGETVGGLQMLRGTSNTMGQYIIRVFSETWVEKVLNHVDELEQYYESDMELLVRMANKANLPDKYGIEAITEDLLMAPACLSVNVANSAQDPTIRLEAFTFAMRTYAEFRQIMPPDIDPEAVKAQIFGLLGFRDAKKFNADQDANPELEAAKQMIQELQQALESKLMEVREKNQAELQKAQIGFQETLAKLQSDQQTEAAKLFQEAQARNEELQASFEELTIRLQSEERDSLRQERTDTYIAQLQESTKILLAQMQRDSQENQARASEETRRFMASMQDDTKKLLAVLSALSSARSEDGASMQSAALMKAITAINQSRETGGGQG